MNPVVAEHAIVKIPGGKGRCVFAYLQLPPNIKPQDDIVVIVVYDFNTTVSERSSKWRFLVAHVNCRCRGASLLSGEISQSVITMAHGQRQLKAKTTHIRLA
jgi:hypothetical protein